LSKIKIGIDPGHGGKDRANRGPTGYIEADGVLDISKACAEELLQNGFEVEMTRQKDESLSLKARADILNKANVDIAISIHTNAVSDYRVRGIETIHSVFTEGIGDELAKVLAKQLSVDLDLPIRRVFCLDNAKTPHKDDYYGIIRKTRMPCVIVEVEFHSNPKAEALLKDSDFRKRVGISIAKGIINFSEVS
jgi:N-acetylmuramoyl-L-alanine amidase